MTDVDVKALLNQLVIATKDSQEKQERSSAALIDVQNRLAEEKTAHAAALLEAQEKSNAALLELQEKQHQEKIAADAKFEQLLATVRAGQGNGNQNAVNVQPASDEAIRAEKIQKINFNLRKSNRLKIFKVSADTDIKLFIKKFEEELFNMKVMVGLNEVLSKQEYVPIFRSCLDYPVVERVSQVIESKKKLGLI